MSQTAWFFLLYGMNLRGITVRLSVYSSSSKELVFQSVNRPTRKEHRTISFSQSANSGSYFLDGKWQLFKKLVNAGVGVRREGRGGGVVKRASLALGSFHSRRFPQSVKLPFLSNRSARCLEIISIMLGSSKQVRAGG